MTELDIREIAELDFERMKLESADNTLRGLEWDEVDKIHVDHVLNALRARIDRIDGILRGDAE